MGYMTGGDRKRDLYSSYSPYFSPDSHISKRPRVSPLHYIPDRTLAISNSTVEKLSRYPERTAKLVREVHAPCRNLKYGLGALRSSGGSGGTARFVGVGRESKGVEMLSSAFNYARRVAIGTLRFVGIEKGVPRLDEESEKPVDVLESDDSGIDDVHVIDDNGDDEENGKEVRSMVLDEVLNEQENDVKVLEMWSGATHDGNMEVEKAREMVDSMGLDRSGLSVEVYKKLLDSAQRNDPNVLKRQIEYYETKRSSLEVLRSMRKPLKKEPPREPFIPLTKEEETEVKRALLNRSSRMLLVNHDSSGIDVTGEILQCLKPGAWLNDEVINVYLELLKEREKREPKKFLKCHFCNTFFYKKTSYFCHRNVHYIQLTGGGKRTFDYRAVKRWTTERKLGYMLFDCEKIFVPIHREIHWCLAIINKRDRKFQYLDSLKGKDLAVLENLARYYVEEVKDKSKIDIDISDWEYEFPEALPEQLNGYDCGMFMIKYADFYSRGLDLCFSQENMPYFRLRTAKEILRLKAD
nr:early in short days 4-like protein [Linum usitatissimum]URG86744.1 early in short days 4-like protein [Linum usitatissimum]URG86745.1 early in short days 4-like protein [Linum usitatissimum]